MLIKKLYKGNLFYYRKCNQVHKRFFRADLAGVSGFNRFSLHKDPFYETRLKEYTQPKKHSVTVSVTGAAGNIGYALLFNIASGQMFGQEQPVYINAIELPSAMNKLKGVEMELRDCAFPLLKGIKCTDNLDQGFEDTDYALLVGSKPRSRNQERGDLLKENGEIFKTIGGSLNRVASSNCKVVVVGNPANTNCLICAHNAPKLSPKNFTAMMRLDHDRGISMAAQKLGQDPQFITEFCVWGNHSPAMFPDLTFTRVYGEHYRHIFGNLEFEDWNRKHFIPAVQNRGAEVIKARGSSSAASAANAVINHMRDWIYGTNQEKMWVSMAVRSDGSYKVPEGLWSGFPVDCVPQKGYEIVKDLPLTSFQDEMIARSAKELSEERDAVAHLIN